MSATLRHVCHARGCNTPISPKMAMCRRHWFKVPEALQAQIYELYREGQEIDKKPSVAYLEALKRAIEAVAAKERKWL